MSVAIAIFLPERKNRIAFQILTRSRAYTNESFFYVKIINELSAYIEDVERLQIASRHQVQQVSEIRPLGQGLHELRPTWHSASGQGQASAQE